MDPLAINLLLRRLTLKQARRKKFDYKIMIPHCFAGRINPLHPLLKAVGRTEGTIPVNCLSAAHPKGDRTPEQQSENDVATAMLGGNRSNPAMSLKADAISRWDKCVPLASRQWFDINRRIHL